ncbi:MAG: 3-dehydroquinate synthase II [Thermoplasmata archaeon]|nr:MAG: 3-dehydroquinate synthase II [Thermoplasmata archaeon]
MKKIIWIDSDVHKKQEIRKKIAITALINNFTDIIVREEDQEIFQKLGKFNLISLSEGKIKMDDGQGEHIEIQDKTDEERAKALEGKMDYVLVSAENWKVIPVENLIAAFQNSKSKLLVKVNNVEDAKLFFETLEVGVDGVVLSTVDFNRINNLRRFMDEFEKGSLSLVSARITKLKPLGMGDRVCIDTCSMLNVGEGMLIGSQSNGMFLVHSESVESEFADTRPFRVNAGPVHSYILAPNEKTKYLSDLKSGDEVLVIDSQGSTRPVILGRVKIEKRPMVFLEAEYEGRTFNIILQNAETIRLISQEKPVSIVDLNEGDSVLVWMDDKGRHFGTKVDESIQEK